jgi:DNA replication protein DnaC
MNINYKQIIPRVYHEASYERDVLEGIKEITREQIGNRKGLYIYGGTGVGKTHVACALAKKFIESGLDVLFYNTGDFLEKIREEFGQGNYEDDYEGLFRETMNFKGILIFDDIGSEKTSDWVAERLYLIINKKWEDMIPMIFTSNCDLEILSARLGDRVASRIRGMTALVRLDGEDKRLNMNIQKNETSQ